MTDPILYLSMFLGLGGVYVLVSSFNDDDDDGDDGEKYIYNFDNYKLDLAANEVLSLAINTNLYLNDNQPWVLIKEKDNLPLVKEIIYNVLESTRIIGLLLLPLLPELSIKINEQLGSIYREEIPWKQQLSWGLLVSNSSLPKPTPIINKLEYEQHL